MKHWAACSGARELNHSATEPTPQIILEKIFLLDVEFLVTVFSFSTFFVFLTKISPELTSAANPPLFAKKTGPELTSVPIFLYFKCQTPATAWLIKSAPRIQTRELWAAEAECANLTATPLG